MNPTNRNADTNTKNLQLGAKALGLQLAVLPAGTARAIDAAFATIQRRRVDALLVGDDPFFRERADQLTTLAAGHRVAAIYFARVFAASGGLASYGASFVTMYRLAGEYAGRILKGEKPADVPVQEPTKFELVINLKAAKALGLEIPALILAQADDVIQ